jgi:hypothetical protein
MATLPSTMAAHCRSARAAPVAAAAAFAVPCAGTREGGGDGGGGSRPAAPKGGKGRSSQIARVRARSGQLAGWSGSSRAAGAGALGAWMDGRDAMRLRWLIGTGREAVVGHAGTGGKGHASTVVAGGHGGTDT